MVHSSMELFSNGMFFQVSELKSFKQRLTTRKLIKDLERHAKINFKNLRSKLVPRSNILGSNSLNSVAFGTFATANFEPSASQRKIATTGTDLLSVIHFDLKIELQYGML